MKKYTKHILVSVIALFLTVGVVYGDSISQVASTDTIGTLRTTVNHIIGHVENTTSTIGAISNLATTTGNIIVATTTGQGGWTILTVGTDGKVLVASSTAPNGLAWETDQTGAAASVGGSDTQIQYNNGGAFAGSASFLFSSSTQTVTIPSSTFTGISVFQSTARFTTLFGNVLDATTTNVGTLNATTTNVSVTLKVPNGTACDSNAAGELCLDTTDDQLIYYGGAERVLPYKKQISATIASSSFVNPILLGKLTDGITVTQVDCIVDPADTGDGIIIDVDERDANGDSPVTIFNGNLQCLTTNTATTTFANAAIDAGDYWSLDLSGAASTTADYLNVTITYTITRE